MARPRSIDDAQILDAAREVFLEDGIAASTASIARRAGISEGTIFKRFPNKTALFFAALGFDGDRTVGQLPIAPAGEGDLRESLVTLGVAIVAFFEELLPRVMRLCSHPSYDPIKLLAKSEHSPPTRAIEALSGHLAAEMELGRLRPADPTIAARVFVGALHNFAFFRCSGIPVGGPQQAAEYVRGVVDVMWSGVGPGNEIGRGEP